MGDGRRVMRLQCAVQNYAWGRVGEKSCVGRLYSLQSKTPLVEDKPYAELWMGTHQSGPSFVVLDKDEQSTMSLKDWLSKHPKSLGDKVLQRWGTDLPFLFKVLSIQTALSIQAHPDKQLAKQLHRLQPDIYKDANHKPEMALALSHFEALCGFVSPEELRHAIETVPELQRVLGESLSKALLNLSLPAVSSEMAKLSLKTAFTTIMTASKDVITDALAKLLSRLVIEEQERSLTSKEQLVMRLAKQYPDDVGVLSAFFFNHILLDPGQAMYLDANEPHAYLSGECLECMATSDNVVRAGLTPKYIDTQTLCAMLTYKQEPPEILSGITVDMYTKRYLPPFDEFEVDCSIVPAGQTVVFHGIPGPSIVIVLKGTGIMSEVEGANGLITALQRGDIFFVPAGIKLELTANSEPSSINALDEPLHLYRAGVSTKVLLGDVNGAVINQLA